MLVSGHNIDLINPNDLTLAELRRANRFLRELHSIGEVDAPKIDALEDTDKALTVIMLSLAQQVPGCGIDRDTWDMAQTVTVAELNRLADGRHSEPAPESTGRVVELTGELTADATMLSPTSAGS